jgi:hypothetical protein
VFGTGEVDEIHWGCVGISRVRFTRQEARIAVTSNFNQRYSSVHLTDRAYLPSSPVSSRCAGHNSRFTSRLACQAALREYGDYATG